MSTRRGTFQTLLDEWANAIIRRDNDQTIMLRRTIDKRLDDLFAESADLYKRLAMRPISTTPPRPEDRRIIPPKFGPCPSCNGTGRKEEGNAILRCRACAGEGKVLVAPSRFA